VVLTGTLSLTAPLTVLADDAPHDERTWPHIGEH